MLALSAPRAKYCQESAPSMRQYESVKLIEQQSGGSHIVRPPQVHLCHQNGLLKI